MRNPFIPKKVGNTVIVDGRVPQEIFRNLRKLNLNIIPTIKCTEVPDPISYHPDIVLHPINHKTIVVAPNVFEYYMVELSKLGIRVIEGESVLGEDYIEHIAYNVGRIGRFVIHNLEYMDEKLKCYLEREDLDFIHVNQGYTKCSMAIVNREAIITADIPIYEKLKDLGIDVLLIESGHIELEGHTYGFIGGASGNLSNDNILLAGSIDKHPDRYKILEFLKKHRTKIIYLSEEKIVDVGTIIALEN